MDQALVKSAARAFEIMEVFADERRRLTLTQLGAALDYPKSSLNVLLKSLAAQGYLSFRPTDLSYFPTLRLSALGEWLPDALFDADALPLLMALRDATGETVTLTAPSGDRMRCLRVVLGTHLIALQLDRTTTFPLAGTAVGTAYLATLKEPKLASVLRRCGVGRDAQSDHRAMIAEAQSTGYATGYDKVTPDAGAVAMAIGGFGETLVVAVAGLSHRIKAQEAQIVADMRRLLNDHLVGGVG